MQNIVCFCIAAFILFCYRRELDLPTFRRKRKRQPANAGGTKMCKPAQAMQGGWRMADYYPEYHCSREALKSQETLN